MKHFRSSVIGLVVGVLAIHLAATRVAVAQDTNEKIKIGETAPTFRNLPGVDGKSHSLSDYTKSAKCIVLAITCNHCPIAETYEDRMIQFAKDYEAKGVKLIAISISNYDEDKLPAMKVRAKEKSFPYPYLHDASQEMGKQLGAAVTPEFFVLDAKGKVVFTGAMDDNLTDRKVTREYLREAVDAVLAGKPVEMARVRRNGCSIEYEASEEKTTTSSEAKVSLEPVDYAGYRAAVAKHRGKVVVVDAWATWCIPCVKNFPHLVAMHQEYSKRGLVCVSLSLDYLDPEDSSVKDLLPKVKEFLAKQGATFDNYLSTEPFEEIATEEKLGVGQIPAVFIFDKKGERVRMLTPGPDLPPTKMYETVEEIVKQLLDT